MRETKDPFSHRSRIKPEAQQASYTADGALGFRV